MDPEEPVETAAETRRLANQLRAGREMLATGRRRPGPEIDYGSIWTTPARPEVWHRVSWNTGNLGLTLTRLDTGQRELLGHYPDRDTVETTLAGWADHADHPASITWLRSRLGQHPVTTIARPGQQRLAGTPPDRQTRFARLAARQDRRELDRYRRPTEAIRGREH